MVDTQDCRICQAQKARGAAVLFARRWFGGTSVVSETFGGMDHLNSSPLALLWFIVNGNGIWSKFPVETCKCAIMWNACETR